MKAGSVQREGRTTTLTAGDLEFHFFISAAQPTRSRLNTRTSHSVSLHVLLVVTAIAAGTPAARAAEVWHFLDYWHFHRTDNVELCQGRADWRKDKTYVDPLRAKINDHLNSWSTVWQDRASGKWRMVYSATRLRLITSCERRQLLMVTGSLQLWQRTARLAARRACRDPISQPPTVW